MSWPDHAGAAALHQLGEVGIVILGPGQDDLAAEVLLLVRFTGLHLFGGLTQIGENQVLRTCQRDQLNHMKLITGNGGIVQLAVASDLVDEAADLVVLLDGGHDCLVGGVNAEMSLQLVEDVGTQLITEVFIGNLIVFEGDVAEGAEEVIVVDDAHVLDGVKVLLFQMLLETAGCAAGRSQSDREAAGQVEKYFRHEVAGIATCALAIGFGLFDKVVVGFLKQILKVDQVFEISHR